MKKLKKERENKIKKENIRKYGKKKKGYEEERTF